MTSAINETRGALEEIEHPADINLKRIPPRIRVFLVELWHVQKRKPISFQNHNGSVQDVLCSIGDMAPALATRMSSLPKRARSACTARSALCVSRTSATSTSTSALGTASRIKVFVSPSASSERATIASAAPARAYCREISCPIPREAPVTSTTLPLYDWEAYSGCGSMAGYTLRCGPVRESESLGRLR